MPCLKNFTLCNKNKCDKGCWSCDHWEPSRSSVYNKCLLENPALCPSGRNCSESCIDRIPKKFIRKVPRVGTEQDYWRIQKRQWRDQDQNQDKEIEYRKKRYAKNKDKMKKKAVEYRKNNPEIERERKRRWREKKRAEENE